MSYKDKNKARVSTTLGSDFVEGCIEEAPRSRSNPVDHKKYMEFPIRRRIYMHVRQYVEDMDGSDLSYIINGS